MFSMYSKNESESRKDEEYCNVWLAVSDDGVHWKDYGIVISAPFRVYAMAIYKAGDVFYLNHGSYSDNGCQNVLRFWKSENLTDWEYLGKEYDLRPDTRYYDENSRLDCMDVLINEEDGKTVYNGYATGPGGWLISSDGINWEGKRPPIIEWGEISPPPIPEEEGIFEIGGCKKIGEKYYLIGGWFNYMGYSGYGVYTLIGDSPDGLFKPDITAYRLNGNSKRWINMWARFCRADNELLISSYLYDGYTYEKGSTYLPPLKKAVADDFGHLRMRYWCGNEAVKGRKLPFDCNNNSIIFNDALLTNLQKRFKIINDKTFELSTCEEIPSYEQGDYVPTAIVQNEFLFDFYKGVILEGKIKITSEAARCVAGSIGFYLAENSESGTYILFDSYGVTRIGQLTVKNNHLNFVAEDETRTGFCAAIAGITPQEYHTFRIFARKNMFETYIDDCYIQTFNTTHFINTIGVTPKKIGFIIQNGIGIFEDICVYEMNIED